MLKTILQQTHWILCHEIHSIICPSTESVTNNPRVKYQWQATIPQWLVLSQHGWMFFVQSTEWCLTAVTVLCLSTKQWCKFLYTTQHSRISWRPFKYRITMLITKLLCNQWQSPEYNNTQIHQRNQLPTQSQLCGYHLLISFICYMLLYLPW